MKHTVVVEIDTEHLGCLKAFELASAYASATVEFKQTGNRKSKHVRDALNKEIVRRYLKNKLPFNTEIYKQYYGCP